MGAKDIFVRENGRIRSVGTQARSHKREREVGDQQGIIGG